MYSKTAQLAVHPTLQLTVGLYRASRPKAGGMFSHVGILDVGDCRGNPEFLRLSATVLHLGPSGFKVEPYNQGDGWVVEARIPEQTGAVHRLRSALDLNYDAFSNNCEHFVERVAVGVKASRQLQSWGLVLGAAAVVTLAAKR